MGHDLIVILIMKPLQVYVEDEELEQFAKWARARRMTKSQAIRAAIRALVHAADAEPLLALSGMVHDRLPPDCSERFDHYMQETFVAEPPASYARSSRRTRSRSRR